MNQPRVGIPPCLDERGRWRAGRRTHYLDAAYAEAIERAGGVALVLPLRADPTPLLEGIQGLLIPGGDDLPPPRPYPAPVTLELVPERQLAFDRRLLAGARARGLPVLGICYGMQLLALEHGGRLHYHLPSDVPGAGEHRLAEPDGRHPLRVDPNSRLAKLLGPHLQPVNSRHHQAVAEPGQELRACAWAGDGVVEAIEHRQGAFRLGVQWHPETAPGPGGERLFAAFVEACRAAR